MSDPDPSAGFALARHRMVEEQLRRRGITSRRVLAAIEQVPRERFLPEGMEREAYADRALPVECGQTISQPYIVGLMTQALELTGSELVLEVGTGRGYQTAVLSKLAAWVVSIERHAELSARAAAILNELGCANVELVTGDGSQGWPARAPYDRIIVTAAAEKAPAPLIEQLKDGGIMVIPVGSDDSQILERIDKREGRLMSVPLSPVRFVPLVMAVKS